ncbi:TraX family protein [Vermiculatibacterium agrestimuris]|uniref:TraX family protein n=1 Tax=Vermiculatibacterium agrestimuris TaxID=2941519 RepID=UPI00203FA25B|nr:TraX family protein [Vermiculatibacterium agrestimuris]
MSSFTLKIIALLTMLWDHIAYVYPPALILPTLFPAISAELFEALFHASHYIGRVSAPIFLWAIAQGYRHTKDFKKYALRLLIFACLAEGPYSLLFQAHGNIIFTQLIGLLTLRAMDWGNKSRPGLGYVLAALSVFLSWHFALFEGGGRYILFILTFYLTDHWFVGKKALLWLFLYPSSRWKLLALTLSEGLRLSNFVLNGFGPLLGVGLTFLYNEKKGPDIPFVKWLWYFLYPAHLLALGLLAS